MQPNCPGSFTYSSQLPSKLAPSSKDWIVPNRESRMSIIQRFARDEMAATAIEYGLIAAGISVVIIVVVNQLGTQLVNTFTNVSTQLGTAGNK
jgi:pilus assembly protein Flp/PilA